MFNYAKLYYGHLKNSKKVILISTIGLICAITIVSSSLLYVDSSKAEVVDTLLGVTNKQNYDIEIEMNYRYPLANTHQITAEMVNITNNLINQANLDIFTNLDLFYSNPNGRTPQNYYLNENLSTIVLNNSVTIVELNSAIRADLQSFLTFQSHIPEINASIQQAFALETNFGDPFSDQYQYFVNHSLLNLENSSIVPVYEFYPNIGNYDFNITGRGRIMHPFNYVSQRSSFDLTYYDPNYPALSKIWKNLGGPRLIFFVNNLTRFTSALAVNHDGVYYQQIAVFGGLNIDLARVDPLVIASRTNEITKFTNSLEIQMHNSDFYNTLRSFSYYDFVYFSSKDAYTNMQNATTSILFNMFVYALPIIIVAILMSNYSFGLIHKRVLSYIGIYKTRGASQVFIFIFEIIDFVCILALSLIVGALSGIPIASLVSKTDFLLSFNKQTNYDIIDIFLSNISNILEILFVFSIITSIIINLRRTINLANMSIEQTENPVEKTDPYWKRHYFDFILFGYGLVSYMVLVYLLANQGSQINPIINLVMYLSLPSPFAMVVGAILISNRITPVIMSWIGKKLWHFSGGLFAFSFKNVIRHHQASTRAIMLIASLLTFLILFYSLPYSEINYQQKVSLFENGAEGILPVRLYDSSNVTEINQMIASISNLLDNNFSTSLDGYSPYFKSFFSSNNVFGSEHFLFINTTTFIQGSSIKQFNLGLKTGNTLEKDLKILATQPNSIIINQVALKDRLLSLNDNVTFTNGALNLDYSIVDSYHIWPTTTRDTWDTSLYAISDMNNVLNLNTTTLSNTIYSSVQNLGFYLNFKDGVNKTAVIENISLLTGMHGYVSNYEPQNWDVYNNLIFQFQIGQINVNILMSLVIGAIILIMFSYMQLNDRRREIYTELALGMKLRQTSSLFFIESILLLITGMVVGTVLGIFFVQMLIIFQTRGTQIPSYIVITPWDLIAMTYLGFIFLALASAIIPAYYVSKQDISRSFITDA